MVFNFYIGGYFHDHSYRITLDGDTIHVSDFVGLPDPALAKTVPVDGNKDWEHLVVFMEGCSWKKSYDSDILDGTQWEIKVKGNSININSYGSNAYPDDFNDFLELLNKTINATGIYISR